MSQDIQENQETSSNDVMPEFVELGDDLRKSSIILSGLMHLAENDDELASKIHRVIQCANEIDINDHSISLKKCCDQLNNNLDGVEPSVN